MEKTKESRIRRRFKRFFKEESGQGMTEYILMVGLIALASMTAIYYFGDNIKELFAQASEQLDSPTEAVGRDVETEAGHARSGMWDESN